MKYNYTENHSSTDKSGQLTSLAKLNKKRKSAGVCFVYNTRAENANIIQLHLGTCTVYKILNLILINSKYTKITAIEQFHDWMIYFTNDMSWFHLTLYIFLYNIQNFGQKFNFFIANIFHQEVTILRLPPCAFSSIAVRVLFTVRH